MDGYDIIGDIHGEYLSLVKLLEQLDYQPIDGIWQHQSRKVIFLGDFIDRGLQQRKVLDLVMPMVDQGHAKAVMGNHEFNALAFHTRSEDGATWLRPRTNKNIRQHLAFLCEYLEREEEMQQVLGFFKKLPLWLDIEGLRVVHACWSEKIIRRLEAKLAGARLTEELLRQASTAETPEYNDLETLLKGRELPLPGGIKFLDKDGTSRDAIRVRWWDKRVTTYRQAYLGPEESRSEIPEVSTEGEHLLEYGEDEVPVFLGHYWMTGEPAPLAHNIACLDYSVAKPGGKLVAYRWSGERRLRQEHFVQVNRVEQTSGEAHV